MAFITTILALTFALALAMNAVQITITALHNIPILDRGNVKNASTSRFELTISGVTGNGIVAFKLVSRLVDISVVIFVADLPTYLIFGDVKHNIDGIKHAIAVSNFMATINSDVALLVN